ncbi:hypothetical protein [uncultured Desulfosarcina sp.]|nr:hypothetical protein [uncultured Desulfosarcina sp.]
MKPENKFSEKQRQWMWFAGLLVAGMAGMLLLAGVVRLLLKMAA